MPEKPPSHQQPGSSNAVIRLRGLSPRSLSRVKWWVSLAREAKATAGARSAPAGGTRTALRLARAGFTPSSGTLYGLNGSGGSNGSRAEDYMSDRQRELTWGIDWPAAGLLDDKLAFFFMLRNLGVPTPEITGVVTRGRVHQLGAVEGDSSLEWLHERLEQRGRVVVRPTRDGAGRGLLIVERSGDGYRVNGEATTWADLQAQLRTLDDSVISDFVEQGSYARAIFPGTPNTVRVLTMHGSDGRPFIAAAAHRFGAPASGPVDNWSRGGLSVRVDPEDGTLGPAATAPGSGALEWHDRHPGSGAQLTGVRIPNWATVRNGIVAAAAKLPFLPYVGWDVIVTDDGFTMVEGNKFSGVHLLQVHKPLMADERVRAFFAEHGVV